MACWPRQPVAISATLAAMVLVSACAGNEGRRAVRPRPSLVSEVSSLPAFVTPAVWRYHPPRPARVNAELALPSGERVLAGRRGERWLVSKNGQGLAAASVLAPEDLVGILKGPFQAVHVNGARNVAEAAAEAGVPSLVHVSAIGADPEAESNYGRTKGEGEEAVRAAFPAATIIRPSIAPDAGGRWLL